MSGGDFLDSNVFVYLFDETDERKQQVAYQLVSRALETDGACISFQVVQETLNVLTRKFAKRANADFASAFLRDSLAPLWRVFPSPALYERGVALHQSLGFAFYDSLIVAAALEAGCKRLLTEDLQHGQRIEGLRIENPFKH